MKNSISSFRVFNFTYYLYLAVFVGFTMPYLKNLGYSASMVGLFMSLIYLFAILGQLISGYICDLKATIKYVYISCIIGLTATVYLLFNTQSTILIGLLLCVVGFFQSPSFSLLDCWVLESSTDTRDNFGTIRAFGSIGWGLSTLLVGKLIDLTSYNIIPYIFLFLSIFVVGIAVRTTDAQKSSSDTGSVSLNDVKELLHDKKYLHLITIFLLCYISFQSITMISTILLTEISGKAWHIGLFTFISSWAEIPILLSANKLLRNIDNKKILIISALFFLIRSCLTYYATSALYLIILSTTQMLSFGIFIFITKYLVDEISPTHLKTSSQTIAIAFSSGISGIIASNATGLLIDNVGIYNTVIVTSFISFIGLVLSVWYYHASKTVNYKI